MLSHGEFQVLFLIPVLSRMSCSSGKLPNIMRPTQNGFLVGLKGVGYLCGWGDARIIVNLDIRDCGKLVPLRLVYARLLTSSTYLCLSIA